MERIFISLTSKFGQSPNNAFYKEVETNGVALWRVPPGRILYLSPGLTVYALPTAIAN